LINVVAGDDPALIKTKLRHWAQAVACSVMQSHSWWSQVWDTYIIHMFCLSFFFCTEGGWFSF